MRADQVEQVQAHIFGWRRKLFPALRVFGAQSSPERVNQFETDRDVSDQFAAFVIVHDETVFRQSVFPELTGIMKEDSGDEKIDIQLWIKWPKRHRNSHHLRSVLH